jgi:hypothetical protein
MRRTTASLAALLCLGCPAWAADPPRAPAPPPATREEAPQPPARADTTPAPMAHPVPPSVPPGSITVRLNGQMGVSGGVGLR